MLWLVRAATLPGKKCDEACDGQMASAALTEQQAVGVAFAAFVDFPTTRQAHAWLRLGLYGRLKVQMGIFIFTASCIAPWRENGASEGVLCAVC